MWELLHICPARGMYLGLKVDALVFNSEYSPPPAPEFSAQVEAALQAGWEPLSLGECTASFRRKRPEEMQLC